jgi:hypothetical protein
MTVPTREPGRRLLYLCGPPAAGKSSLMAALTAGCYRLPRAEPGKPEIPYELLIDPISGGPAGLELGRRRESFSGTDAMAMNVAPAVCRWLATSLPGPLILAEGDRLGYPGFLDAASGAGYAVTLVHVTADPADLEGRRRVHRARQNETWARGRATKAANLAAHAQAQRYEVVRLNTSSMDGPDGAARWLRVVVPWLAVLPAGAVATADRP